MRNCIFVAFVAIIGLVGCTSHAQGPVAAANPALAVGKDLADTWTVKEPTDKPGEPVLEEPTLHCLGVYWIIAGDAKKKARVEVAYRKAGDKAWKPAMPLFRVQHGATAQRTHRPEVLPLDNAWLFAGSIFNLAPDTPYEIKLRLVRGDGSSDERLLRSRTRAEPAEPKGMRVRHVVPGKGGGSGTKEDPFQGLDYAQGDAHPGDLFLVHAGTYEAPFHAVTSGTPEKPIIWRGAGDGEAIIDGGGKARIVVEISSVHDVWLERVTIQGAYLGVRLMDSSRVVIRRCHVQQVKCGIYGFYTDDRNPSRGYFFSDNALDGPFDWARGAMGAGEEEWRGIQITGVGHVVCYNRIRAFKDGMDTFPARYMSAVDFHNNDVSRCMDDGCEMDFSERNTRCFNNRFVDCFQGVSEQPIFGGPTYIFRNVLYNIYREPFKLHHNGGPGAEMDWAPSGALILHNTIVNRGAPMIVDSNGTVYNCVFRNNLFLGRGQRAMHFNPRTVDCDFDYDGFGGGPWEIFMKWDGKFYDSPDEARRKAPVERHSLLVDLNGVFSSGISLPAGYGMATDPAKIDLRLKKGTAAIDAGEVLPTINDGFTGKAPDVGAFELGQELPQYGPRPESTSQPGK